MLSRNAIIIGFWQYCIQTGITDLGNIRIRICVCTQECFNCYSLQHIFVALSNVANHRHVF